MRADWGNPVHVAFMNAVSTWEPRVLAVNADGFFKVIIRKHPDADCWSWAIEWNHALRIIGFAGDVDAAKEIAGTFPQLEVHSIHEAPNQFFCHRTEVAIKEEDDILFEYQQ
jgi:hypothetical protein